MDRLTRFLSSRNSLFITGLLALAIMAVVMVLVLPAILRPPAELGPAYDVFNERMAGSTIEPDKNSLIELPESGVSAFIPANSIQEAGQILIKERREDLVPYRITEDFIREQAVDLLFVNREGSVQVSYPLREKI